MLLPETWDKYKNLPWTSLDYSPDHDLASACRNIQQRNERLVCNPFKSGNIRSHPKRDLIACLDAFNHDTQFGELSGQCFDILEDKLELSGIILAWASSNYRIGDHRIYLAVRLLRNWHSLNIDINEAVLSFLRFSAVSKTLSRPNVFRIVAELVRTGHFSVGRYLQWLISEGCLAEENEVCMMIIMVTDRLLIMYQRKSFHLQLLAELPSQRLPKHIVNLKHVLLQQTRLSLSQGLDDDDGGLSVLAQRVPKLLSHTIPNSNPISVGQLSISGRLGLARQLRHCIQCHTKPDDL